MQKKQSKTRILLCADNRVGYEVMKLLSEDPGVEIAGVITHPSFTALFREEIDSFCQTNGYNHWDINFARKNFEEVIRPTAPDFLVSIYFDYILDHRFLTLPQKDAINLHPGYLPYNKGFYYYVWALVDGTPAGVSIHRMAGKVDSGEIISQKQVLIAPEDTGESIYRKHEDASIWLFKATWPTIANGTCKFYKQRHRGTHKSLKYTRKFFQVDPYETVKSIDLINRLRSLSFNREKGCTIKMNGKEYLIRLQLEELPEGCQSRIPGGFNDMKN